MAFQQNFDSPAVNFGSEGNGLLKQKLNSVSASATASENVNGCFDCNICLDSSNEPVVTLCGHLYCWPCIYKWLQVQNTSPDSGGQPKCPVCKSYISTSSMVPLYGRGTSSASKFEAKKPSQLDMAIPQRPPAIGTNAVLATATSVTSDPNQPNPFWPQNRTFHQHQYFTQPFGNYSATTNIFSNMVSEMVFSRMFGSPDSSLFAHPYSNSYHFPGNGSPRMRRQEMQLDKSLNRISEWISSNKAFTFSPGDRAVHLDLIGAVRGSQAADIYFDNLSEQEKDEKIYGDLLNSYAREGLLMKTLLHVQKMKHKGYVSSSLAYNNLMALYKKVGELEKIPVVLSE